MNAGEPPILIRTHVTPGDIEAIVHLHGVLYAREYGFDHTFEAYVAGPLTECVNAGSPRERIWIAEQQDRIVGCIAIVAHSPQVAQLRWFLVDPAVRGAGLGRRLLQDAIGFCRETGYDSVFLWTLAVLTVAVHLYRSAGFEKVEEIQGKQWGVGVVEERYELRLRR